MDIARTLIGTDANPTISGGIDLYQKLHFPDDWSWHGSVTAWNVGDSFDIKAFGVHILEGKLNTRAALALELGVAGPAWAGRLYAEGSASQDELRLSIIQDDFKAGVLLGAAISPQFSFCLQAYTWHQKHWYSRPHKQWRTLCDFEIDLSFDLVGFIYNQIIKPWLIDGIKDLESDIPVAVLKLLADLIPSANANLIASNSGIMNHVAADSGILDWDWAGLELSPDVQLQWDLIELAAALAETIALIPPVTEFGAAAAEVDGITKHLRPTISSGPVVGIMLTVHLKISGLTAFVTGDTETPSITTENIRADGEYLVGDIPDSNTHDVETISHLGIHFTHRASVSLELGWHVGIYWLKILGYDFIKTFNPAALLGVPDLPVSEQYRYRLSNKVGDTDSAAKTTLLDTWIFSTDD